MAAACAAPENWQALNKACHTSGAAAFGGLQLAKDLLDAPGHRSLRSGNFPDLEEWYPVQDCPGTLRGLEWLHGGRGRALPKGALPTLLAARDELEADRRRDGI